MLALCRGLTILHSISPMESDMKSLPSDSELQAMTDVELKKLSDSRPKYDGTNDWVRVAKEIRYRRIHGSAVFGPIEQSDRGPSLSLRLR